MIVNSLTQLIGNTPMLKLNRFATDLNATVYLKLESFNPYSVKDRAALNMLQNAEAEGKLDKDTVIVEPTSGNTGIGLSFIAAIMGYKIILTMPETMSLERRKLLSLLGAQLVLTEGAKGMAGAIEKAEEIAAMYPKSFIPSQFTNLDNPAAHKATADEMIKDLNGKVDIFVAGVGTGGTLMGVTDRLRERKISVLSIAVEPASSAVLSGEKKGPHKIQGIGAGFVPAIVDLKKIDSVIKVADDDAYAAIPVIAATEGLLVGVSGAAAILAAVQLARKPQNKGKNIVTVIPDSGERYLSVL